MSKKVSIITVNYNDKPGLEKTIASVLSQTSTDYEFVVMDGGSTDGSVEVINQHTDRIDIAVSEKDSGVFNAMNKAIKAATGEFLIFMNGGDIFYNEKVLEEVILMLTGQADIYYGDNYKETPGGSKRLKTYPESSVFRSFTRVPSITNLRLSGVRCLISTFITTKITASQPIGNFLYTICKENVPYRYLKKTIAIYDFTGISIELNSSDLFYQGEIADVCQVFPLRC
jgi:glycosyltransferase involved in cell wall biosynthesis